MSKRFTTRTEFNAIIAGLRCLQEVLPANRYVEEILADGDVDAIDMDGIDNLIEAINFGEVQLEGGEEE